jgi:hypothetical protein
VCRYINGLLIPEIHVVRGKTYTFVVEGGQDPEFAAGNPSNSLINGLMESVVFMLYKMARLWD